MHDDKPTAGVPVQLVPGLRRVLAPNPSPMTYHGTNTYLLGNASLAVIDPGPDNAAHLRALLAAIGDTPVSHIIVTHSHLDHSPLAAPLAQATGARVVAFGDARAGRSAVMQRLATIGDIGGGEGVDTRFAPDIRVADGDVIGGDGWQLGVLHTPGHMGNHICLTWGDAVFTGDHVMGWASSLVSPPDGDLTQFMTSCTRLRCVPARVYYPAHGDPVMDPQTRLDWLTSHRHMREAQILAALQDAPATAGTLAARIYSDTPVALLGAATRNVLAHLIDLHGRARVSMDGPLTPDATFRLSQG